MTIFLLSVVETAVTMSAVILLLLLLFRLFGKQLKAKTRYMICVLVLMRLAIPIGIPGIPTLLTIELDMSDIARAEAGIVQPDTQGTILPAEPTADLVADTASTNMADNAQPGRPSDLPVKYQGESVLPPFLMRFLSALQAKLQRISLETWLQFAQWTYVSIALLFFIVPLLTHFLYVYRIKKGRTLSEEKIYSRYIVSVRKNGVANPPLLWVSSAADSPMIIGLFTLRLVLPEGIPESALDGVFAHELKHYTRRDLWVRFLCLLARSLHWWNPFVHIIATRCMLEMELSCDEAVLRACSLEERQQYGNAMLEIMRTCQNTGAAISMRFSPQKAAVKARFAGIVDMQTKKNGTWLIVTTALLCIVSSGILACTLKVDAAGGETNPPVIVDTYSKENFSVTEYRMSDSEVYWDILLANGQAVSHVLDPVVTYRPGVETIVSFEDVNFDGNDDLLLCKGGYGTLGAVYYDCYLYSGDTYTLCQTFSEISNPVAVAQQHVIYSTFRKSISLSTTSTYVYKDNMFLLQNTTETGVGDEIVYFSDFSNANVLNDFVAYRGTWSVRDGRLWLDSIHKDVPDGKEQTCALLLYVGKGCKDLTDYRIDVDIYNIQTQTGVLTRCDLGQSNDSTSNSFYGYFHFISKDGKQGAIGYGCKHGNWGGNLIVEKGSFSPGNNVHLCVIVSGNILRCIYTDIKTGETLLDIDYTYSYWSKGTFGFRMINYYGGNSSLGQTSFDNLKVTKLS